MKKFLYLSAVFSPVAIVIFYVILISFDLEISSDKLVLDISKGSTVSSVAKSLREKKCFSEIDMFAFKLAMKMSFKEDKIYTGRYSLDDVKNIGGLIDLITSNSGTKIKVTFIEGWRVSDYASKLNKELGLDSLEFIELCNSDYIEKFGINAPSCEGYLFPDTYVFLTSYNGKQVFDRLVKQFLNKYNNFVKSKADSKNMSMNEVVTLASIVQAEAGQKSEMNKIASVFYNRLKKPLSLGADPTVLYYMDPDSLILFKKLAGTERSSQIFQTYKKIDHLYNTHENRGLPPGPINNPGISALLATINPEKTDFLYFVSNRKGGHNFSKSLEQHKIYTKEYYNPKSEN